MEIKITKKELYKKIEILRDRLISVGAKKPFDIFDVCSFYEDVKIESCSFNTKGLRGMAVVADESSSINCILVNSNLSYKEQNFHGFHELMHIYNSEINSGQMFNCYDKVKPFQNPYVEWVANEGAAELLLQYKSLLPILKANWNYLNSSSKIYEFKEALSQKFMLPPTVIELRIENLKYETYQYIHGIPLMDIEILSNTCQRAKGIQVDSLNDIHRTLQAQEEFKIFIQKPIISSQSSLEAII